MKLISALLACWLATTGVARAQSLDRELSMLAASLSKALVGQGSKSVAAIDFTDLQGQPTELGRFLSEQLAVEMVLTAGVSMLDRANIKSILAEHKLTEQGLVNPANAKKLGEFAGVDTLLIGTVTSLDAAFVLTVKAISTESAKIVAAGKITFQKTPDLQGIGNRGVSGSVTATGSTKTTAGGLSGSTYQEASAIATKDVGSLRVVLKSVLPVVLNDSYGRSTRGIRASFEFTSRETRRPLVVAINGESQNRNSPTVTLLRSSVLDDRGGVWKLSSPDLGGLGFVHAGVHGRNGQDVYSASEIVRLLRLRDELGRDEDDPADGTNASYGEVAFGAPNKFLAFTGNIFISGSTTTIEPGQTVTVTMSFHWEGRGTNSGSPPTFFQLNSEIVFSVVDAGTKKSYSLRNLTFDRVSMPMF